MPTLGELGNIAPSLGAGDANGVDRGLVEGVSAVIRELDESRAGGAARCVRVVAAGLSVNTGDVSSVTGMGTDGGAGSSNAPQGSSSGGALSNASISVRF
jgi:hypothetical protein